MELSPSGADILKDLSSRALLDVIPDGIIVAAADGTLVFVNAIARQLLRLPPDQPITDKWKKRCHALLPDQKTPYPIEELPIMRALRGEEVQQAEVFIRHVDGLEVWLSVNARPLRNQQGQLIGAVSILRDISARRQIEAQLQESRERLHLAVAAATMGIWEWSTETNEIQVDPTARQLLGCDQAHAVGTQRDNLAHVHPDDHELIKETTRQCLADGEPRRIEYRVIGPDGRERWLADRCMAIADASGSYTRMIGAVFDITERKHIEAALQESEWRFRNAMQHAPIGIALIDLEGRYMEVNQALCAIVGYSAAELGQLRFQDITHAEDLEDDLAFVNQLLQGERGAYQMEKRYRHKAGHLVHAILSVSLLRDAQGKPLYFISQVQDITARKKMEAALRENEARTRLIIEHAHDAFVSIDEGNRIIDWNRRAEMMFGWSRDEALGQNVAELIIPPDYRQAHNNGVKRFLERGSAGMVGKRIEVPALDRTGREFPAEVTVASMRVNDAYVFNAFFHDITERKAMEAHLISIAQQDALTGLPNRRLFYDRLEQAMARAKRHQTLLALLFMDLNGFKRINDTYGHDIGDQVLVQFADSVKRCVRKMDTLARLAGDEFVVIVEDMRMPHAALVVAHKIINALRPPLSIEEHSLEIMPSIGIAVFNENESADSIIKRADQAMYQAKASGSKAPVLADETVNGSE